MSRTTANNTMHGVICCRSWHAQTKEKNYKVWTGPDPSYLSGDLLLNDKVRRSNRRTAHKSFRTGHLLKVHFKASTKIRLVAPRIARHDYSTPWNYAYVFLVFLLLLLLCNVCSVVFWVDFVQIFLLYITARLGQSCDFQSPIYPGTNELSPKSCVSWYQFLKLSLYYCVIILHVSRPVIWIHTYTVHKTYVTIRLS